MKHNLSQLAILKKSLNLLVIVAMIFGMVVPAFAEESPITNQQEQEADYTELLKEVEAQKTRYEHAVQQMERHLSIDDKGLLQLDVDSGLTLGIDERTFQELSLALALTNERIASGKLSLQEIALQDGKNIFGEEIQRNPEGYMPTCAGWTGITYSVWGPVYYLNDCHTQTVTNLLGAGAGAGAICAFLSTIFQFYPGVAVCTLLGGLFAIGGGLMAAVNAWGGFQGIYFQQAWTGPILWWWHQ
jgi:hypothetical protein